MLNLNTIMLNSENPDKLAKFYEELFQTKPGWQDSGFIGYQVGTGYFVIGPHDKIKGKNQNPERVMLNFEAKDVEGEFNRVKQIEGVTVIKEPYHPGPDTKATLSTFADPDGNYFQLTSPFGM